MKHRILTASAFVGGFSQLLTTSATVWAHPGHAILETDGNTLTHYAVEPMHFMPWILIGLVLCAVLAYANKQKMRLRR